MLKEKREINAKKEAKKRKRLLKKVLALEIGEEVDSDEGLIRSESESSHEMQKELEDM